MGQRTLLSKNKISSEIEQQILQDLIAGNLGKKALSRKYKISIYHIQRIRKTNNISNRNSKHMTSQTLLFEKGLRRCSACKQILPLDAFSLKQDTRPIRGIYSYRCKKCSASVSLAIYHKQYNTLEKVLALRLKVARKTKKELSITLEELLTQYNKQQGKCFYTGVSLLIVPNKPETLSLDRIDSKRGYHADNIVFCTARINRMKREMSLSEFVDTCMAVIDHFYD